MNRALVYLLFFYIFRHTTTSSPISDGSASRHLLQIRESITVDASNAESFAQSVGDVGRGTRVELDLDDVSLESALTLNQRGVNVIGIRSRRTVIRCNAEGRVEISADDVSFQHVSFEGCINGAVHLTHPEAVYNPFDTEAVYDFVPIRVQFTDVLFENNEAIPGLREATGGALTVGPGTVAVLQSSVFRENRAETGGAVLVDGAGGLEVNGSTFQRNQARFTGGAIAAGLFRNFFDTVVDISIRESTFEYNLDTSGSVDEIGLTLNNGAQLENTIFLRFPTPTPSGGAIFVQGYSRVDIEDCEFLHNSAATAGGALYVSDNKEVHIISSNFINNSAIADAEAKPDLDLRLGGAAFVAFTDFTSQLDLQYCTFSNNTAAHGGALHIVTDLSNSVNLANLQMEDNVALLSGGALLVRNAIRTSIRNIRFYRNRATAGGAVMFTNGAGAVFNNGPVAFTEIGPLPDIFDVLFTENEARNGGGIFFMGSGQVTLQSVRFYRNRATLNGGAACMISSLPSGLTSVQFSVFDGNSAQRGGALYVDGVSDFRIESVSGQNNQFVGNRALAGGAIHISPSSQVANIILIDGAVFQGNKAVVSPEKAKINDLALPDVEIEATALGRRLSSDRHLTQSARRKQQRPKRSLLDPMAVDGCYAGGGGAMCLLAAVLPELSPIDIELMNLEFVANEAKVGGGLYAATVPDDEMWSAQCAPAGTAFESLTEGPCRSLSLTSIRFSRNVAGSAGGGLFVSHPDPVYVDISGSGEYTKLAEITMEADLFDGNSVDSGGYGPDIATNAALMRIQRTAQTEDGRLVAGHNSGESLPAIELYIMDAFNQRVSAGVVDASMSVTVNSPIVSGQRVATAVGGAVEFTRAVAVGPPTEHSIAFVASSEKVPDVLDRFSIRQCYAGEYRIEERNICDICEPEYFGFNYSYTCDGCPSDAICEGAASLIPVSGYWHSSPFSPIMHECLLEEACSYDGRRRELSKYYRNIESVVPSNETVPEEDYPQCSEAYQDVLCGSCAKGYGHVVDGECVECKQLWLTALLIGVVSIWTLFLIINTGKAAYDTIREMGDMRLSRALTMTEKRGSSSRSRRSHGESSSDGPGRKTTFAEAEEVGEEEDDHEADNSRSALAKRRAQFTDDDNVNRIIAAEKVSETIKILTNFFQITAVGVGINARWTRSIQILLFVEDSAASVTSGASFAPMECLMENVEDRTLIGVVIRTLFPIVLTIVYVISSLIKHRTDRGHLYRRMIICILVGVFFAYDSVTEMLMRLINCLSIDSSDFVSDASPIIRHYGQYAIATEEYWAEDTMHVCWKGSHAVVAGILGIPGLIIGTVGIPLGLATFLLYNRYLGKILETDFLNTYGFVYQSYQPKFVYWESIIMLRKAAMAAVIVFSYDLGPNLQSAIALGILIFALLGQFLAHPYKYTSLNVLESLSLLASIFIFYSGVVFRDSNTSYGGKVVLSIIIVGTNILLICMFLYRLFITYDGLTIVKLRLENAEVIPDNPIQRLRLLSQINAAKVKKQIQDKVLETKHRLKSKIEAKDTELTRAV